MAEAYGPHHVQAIAIYALRNNLDDALLAHIHDVESLPPSSVTSVAQGPLDTEPLDS